jgi:hypothetical protein
MALKIWLLLGFIASASPGSPTPTERAPECSPPQRPSEGVNPFEDDGEPEEQAPDTLEGDAPVASGEDAQGEPPPRDGAHAP